MPSQLGIIDVLKEAADGTISIVPSVTVKFYDASLSAAISPDVVAGSDGIIAFPPMAVAVNTLVRARVINYQGAAGYTEIRSI